jgi:hypothetical protein
LSEYVLTEEGNCMMRGGVFGKTNRGTSVETGSGLGVSGLKLPSTVSRGGSDEAGPGKTESVAGFGEDETGSGISALVTECGSSLVEESQGSGIISFYER